MRKKGSAVELGTMIHDMLQYLEHHCVNCKQPATRRVYWKECAANSTYCDGCCALKSSFSYLGEKELEQAEMVRRVNEFIKEKINA